MAGDGQQGPAAEQEPREPPRDPEGRPSPLGAALPGEVPITERHVAPGGVRRGVLGVLVGLAAGLAAAAAVDRSAGPRP